MLKNSIAIAAASLSLLGACAAEAHSFHGGFTPRVSYGNRGRPLCYNNIGALILCDLVVDVAVATLPQPVVVVDNANVAVVNSPSPVVVLENVDLNAWRPLMAYRQTCLTFASNGVCVLRKVYAVNVYTNQQAWIEVPR